MRIEYISAIGTYTATFTYPMHYLDIINDGTESLTLTVNNESVVVPVNESYYEEFDQFTSFVVVSTGAWRAEVRGEDPLGSLTANEIFIGINYELRDLPPTKISSYQQIDALNFVLKLISMALANLDSSITMRDYPVTTAAFDITTAGTSLPSDFLSVVAVYDSNDDECTSVAPRAKTFETNEFKIMGNYIYGDITGASMIYHCMIPSVAEESDMIYLPDNFEILLRKYVKAIITGDISSSDTSLLSTIQNEVASLVNGREMTIIDRPAPFTI